MFLFREASYGLFPYQVFHLTPGYLLQLLSRYQLLLKIQTFKKSDPFYVDDKKGERDFVELSMSFYVFMSLFMYSFMRTCSIWCLDVCFYMIVLLSLIHI